MNRPALRRPIREGNKEKSKVWKVWIPRQNSLCQVLFRPLYTLILLRPDDALRLIDIPARPHFVFDLK